MLHELTLQDPIILFAIGFSLVALLGFLVFFAIRAERDRAHRDIARGNEERLEMVLGGTGLGFWDWNMEQGTISFDHSWYRENLGYEPGEIHEGRDLPGQLAHPADLDRINDGLLEHLLGKTDSYRIEFRYRHRGGRWMWILSRGKVVMRDSTGRAQRMVGADALIESRKRGEELMALERDLAVKLGAISETDHALRQIFHIALSMEAFTVGAVYRQHAHSGEFALLDQVELPDDCLTKCGWLPPLSAHRQSGVTIGPTAEVERELGLGVFLKEVAKVLALVPLRRGNDICGLLVLGSPSAIESSSYLKASLEQLALQANAILLRIQTETYFRENQRNLSYLIDSIDELLFILDPQRRIVFANAVARRQLGYELEELEGMDLLDFYPSTEKSAIEVSFQDLTSGVLPFCNLALRGRDGQIISTELQVTEGRWDRKEVFICLLRDVSLRQRSLEAIRQKDERLHASARALNYLITTDSQDVDLKEAFRIIGRAMGVERLILYRSSELRNRADGEKGLGLRALFCWDHERGWVESTANLDFDLESYPGWKETILQNEAVRVRANDVVDLPEQNLFREFGLEAVLMVPIFLKGEWWGVFWADLEGGDREWTAADVSIMGILGSGFAGVFERNQLETDLVAAKERAEKLAEEARIATEAKSEFVANISHEIRTPMNAILGFAELLERDLYDAKQREFVDAIMASGKALLGLINDLLDLSKIEAGKMNIYPEPIDVAEVLGEVNRVFRLKADQRGLELQLELSSSVPRCLMMDGNRLRQIAFNLVGNAVKFTERGFVKTVVEAEPSGADGVDLWIRVKDSGRGIRAEHRESIFKAFEQVRRRSGEETEGTGLGLAITQRLVGLMGGRLHLESEEGVGSCFEVFIPAVPMVERDMSALPEKEEVVVTVPGSPAEAPRPLDHDKAARILGVAEEQLLPQWERVGSMRQVSQIIAFAEAVQEVGMEHRAEEWIGYGAGLKTAALSFDVSKIRKELERFPQIVQALRDLLADSMAGD